MSKKAPDPFRISLQELERRWALVRTYLRDNGIGALVVQGRTEDNGGGVRWFTDVPATTYPKTVIFHVDDLMTIVEHGPVGGQRALDGRDPRAPGVGEVLTNAALPAVQYTQQADGGSVAQVLDRRGYKKVAFATPGAMAHGLVATITERLAGRTEIVDVSDFIDRVRACKSDYEIGLIRDTAAMQDEVFRRVLEVVRPGMRDADIFALCQYEGRRLGSTGGIFLGGSSKAGEGVMSPVPTGRVLEPGDHLSILIENNGANGFYTELGRSVVLGKATSHQQDVYAFTIAAEMHVAGLCRAGTSCAEVFAQHAVFMRSHGSSPSDRLGAHSQGYDIVERPLIRADETMTIAQNMNLAIHPALNPPIIAGNCNNYLVAGDTTEQLHRTENRIFEV